MLARVRWLRGSVEVHTAQRHAIIGTPCDVPVPMKITSIRGTTEHTEPAEVKGKGGPSRPLRAGGLSGGRVLPESSNWRRHAELLGPWRERGHDARVKFNSVRELLLAAVQPCLTGQTHALKTRT